MHIMGRIQAVQAATESDYALSSRYQYGGPAEQHSATIGGVVHDRRDTR